MSIFPLPIYETFGNASLTCALQSGAPVFDILLASVIIHALSSLGNPSSPCSTLPLLLVSTGISNGLHVDKLRPESCHAR